MKLYRMPNQAQQPMRLGTTFEVLETGDTFEVFAIRSMEDTPNLLQHLRAKGYDGLCYRCSRVLKGRQHKQVVMFCYRHERTGVLHSMVWTSQSVQAFLPPDPALITSDPSTTKL